MDIEENDSESGSLINNVDDEELKKIFNEILQEQQIQQVMNPQSQDIEMKEEIQNVQYQKRKTPNILITGTPGTDLGKSTLSELLCKTVNHLKWIDVGQIIAQQKLYKEWDNKLNVPIFDDDMVIDALEPIIQKEGCVIDFHTSSIFPERWFDLIIVLRVSNTILYDRLSSRGYSKEKIDINLSCEIFGEASNDVQQSYKKDIILELVNETSQDLEYNLNTIIKLLQQKYANNNNRNQ